MKILDEDLTNEELDQRLWTAKKGLVYIEEIAIHFDAQVIERAKGLVLEEIKCLEMAMCARRGRVMCVECVKECPWCEWRAGE